MDEEKELGGTSEGTPLPEADEAKEDLLEE